MTTDVMLRAHADIPPRPPTSTSTAPNATGLDATSLIVVSSLALTAVVAWFVRRAIRRQND